MFSLITDSYYFTFTTLMAFLMISDLSYITEIFCMMSKIFLYLPSPLPTKCQWITVGNRMNARITLIDQNLIQTKKLLTL